MPGKKEDMTVYIGIANCVVDETGRPMPVAKMRRFQIVTELQVWRIPWLAVWASGPPGLLDYC